MKTFIKSNYFPALLATALGLMPMGQVTALTLTTVHSFTATSACCPSTNSDGAFPEAPLVFSSNVLYGTTTRGGGSDNGTVFRVNTDGTAFATLHSFTTLTSSSPRINSGGANPQGGLVSAGNMLYGTASQGGSLGWGTVVKVDTDGNGVTTLHNFAGYPADGGAPYAALIISGNTLYGTTYQGGRWNAGTVFKLNTDGTGFTNLYDFPTSLGPSPATNADGANPAARLTLSGSTLYGTARFGGGFG